ncbi:MAG: NUDIX hydrolase [Lachnospiraceae bacterium]|nr:NUDIX hydrolase [Lachnospiraceae bacterium]
MKPFERLDRRLVAHGHIMDYYEDTIAVPNGNIAHWDFIKHKGAAAVIPVLPDGRILMVRQYRNALDRETIEIPAGGLNENEDPYDCAMRELTEETGYSVDQMEFLISVCTTVAFCNEKIPIYVAFIDGKQGEQHLDEDEYIKVEPYALDDLCDLIYSGQLNDSKTVAAIMAYKNKYEINED